MQYIVGQTNYLSGKSPNLELFNSLWWELIPVVCDPAETIEADAADVKILSKVNIFGNEINLPPMNQEISICK